MKKKSHNKWSFQLLPNTPDVLGKGYRVDTTTQAIEDQVNEALPYYFKFHKIGKLVIRLGFKQGEKDYHEILGVATKYYPAFDIHHYASLDEREKVATMRAIILEVFAWLIDSFQDAQSFEAAKMKLNWS